MAWWWPWLSAVAVAGALLTVAFLWFFRDPDRSLRSGRLLASADGKIQAIDRLPDGRTRIATYLSLSDVHVIRAPVAGRVVSAHHTSGRHRPAFRKDSELNERVHWHFMTELGDIEIIQIAGAMARRIVAYVPVGAKVEQGEKIGLIRFGSRVDVFLPPGIFPGVCVGQRVLAGITRIDID